MTPKRTLLLIALFLCFTLGSFAYYLVRNINAGPEGAMLQVVGTVAEAAA